MAVRAIITAVAVVLSTPALGWDVLSPPQWAYEAGLALEREGRVEFTDKPAWFIQAFCGRGYEPLGIGLRYYGCALPPDETGSDCLIWIASDLPRWFRPEVERHELGHCGGWVH